MACSFFATSSAPAIATADINVAEKMGKYILICIDHYIKDEVVKLLTYESIHDVSNGIKKVELVYVAINKPPSIYSRHE